MPIAVSFLKRTIAAGDDVLVLVEKNAHVDQHKFLATYKAVLDEKIKAGKMDFIQFHEGKRKINVAIYVNKETETSYYHETIRAFGARNGKLLNGQKYSDIAILGLNDLFKREEIFDFLEGLELGNYQFLKYKSKKTEGYSLKKIQIEKGKLSDADITEFTALYEAVNLTKDLVNEPVNFLTAVQFSKEMQKAGKASGFKVEVLSKNQIEALNMGGLLGVNKGSIDPPTFTIMEYKPAKAVNKQPLVFVGKGVVFDTGGYSLKISGSMLTMKCDMAGGAAVLGAMVAIAKNKLPVHVIALVPATDNKISSNALVVDDVITMHDGTTVEVQNTDAEGRLILADALAFAKKYKPELVIDLATLTGAAAAITGHYGSALMGTDTKYRKSLMETGEETYERLAEMPFWKEYDELIKSDIADIRNMGGPVGGSMTAGKFLQRFTDYPWLHIDIAGPAFLKEAKDHHHKGASAVGVRLLYQFTKKLAQSKK